MEHKPSYYAVIPATVRYCKGICDGAKLLYGEITALCNDTGYCWAANEYFAKLYGKSPDTISRWVSELAGAGFIATLVDSSAGNSRKIWLSEAGGIGKNAERVSAKMPRGYRQKCREGIGKNAEYNNTVNNTMNSESGARAHGEKSTPLEAEKTRGAGDAAAPPPDPAPRATDQPLRYDEYPLPKSGTELKEKLRNYFAKNPGEWRDGVLEQSRATKWRPEKIGDCMTMFCAHQEAENNLKRTYGQYKGLLVKWFLNQRRFDAAEKPRQQRAQQSVLPSNIVRL